MKKTFFSLFLFFVLAILMISCIGGTKGRNPRDDKRTRRLYDIQFVKMYFRDVGGLVYKIRDSVVWAEGINGQEMGLVGVWFLEGERFNLSDPHIQVGYFSKKMPQQGSFDEIFAWVESVFVKTDDNQSGIITQPRTQIITYDKSVAEYMSILVTPKNPESEGYKGKWLTYGYVEQGEYMVALVLTAYDQIRFDKIMRLYLDLIETYEKA